MKIALKVLSIILLVGVITLFTVGCITSQQTTSTHRTPNTAPSVTPYTPTPTPKVDLALVNGKIITMDPKGSIAQAISISEGKIIKVGTNEEIFQSIQPTTNLIDLKGKTVTPGIVDSHLHVLYYGGQFLNDALNVRYPVPGTKKELLRLVAERVKITPTGCWIASNQGFCQPDHRLAPNRWDLDAIAPENPVFLLNSTGQYAVVNSYALRLAGINKDKPNPGNGIIDKSATGEPTGLLFHYPAIGLVRCLTPNWTINRDQRKDCIIRGGNLCIKTGITSAQDVILMSWVNLLDYKAVADEGKLPVRINTMLYVEGQDQAEFFTKRPEYISSSSQVRNNWCNFSGYKLAIDGSWTNGTVLMYDATPTAAVKSYPYHTQENLNKIVTMLHKTGKQVAFHVQGDRAIDMALNAIEAALKEEPREDHRFRLEHVTFASQKNIERIKKLGVIVSTSPQWIYSSGEDLKHLMGRDVAEKMIPLKTMLDMGIPVAFGCDEPSSQFLEPKWDLYGAVSRETASGDILGPNECISIQQALRCHTIDAAYAAFEDDIKGSIEEGKLADMVIWSKDLYSIPMSAAGIKDLQPEITILDGKIVFQSPNTNLTLGKAAEFQSLQSGN